MQFRIKFEHKYHKTLSQVKKMSEEETMQQILLFISQQILSGNKYVESINSKK